MSTELAAMETKVLSFEPSFNAVNAYNLNFRREANFALQLLKGNDYLRKVASDNQDSLLSAITNLAAIGVSLNPASKEAYLVPRKATVCLDISAIGLIKIATDSGSILWAQAEIVRKADKFEFKGVGQIPVHQMDPFSDRGEMVGVYVVAKTHSGDFLVTVMSTAEIYDIRDRSEAWLAYKSGKVKSCPWATDEGEMSKKTALKRASKLWPKSERIQQAVDVLNQHEGIDFTRDNTPPPSERLELLKFTLGGIQDGEARLLKHISTKDKVAVSSLEELSGPQVEYSINFLAQYAQKAGA